MFGVRHSEYRVFVEGFNGPLLKLGAHDGEVLAIALNHLAVGLNLRDLLQGSPTQDRTRYRSTP